MAETEKKEFWANEVWGVESDTFFGLITKLNAFYKGKFTIGTQIFHVKDRWHGAIHFKVPPKTKKK